MKFKKILILIVIILSLSLLSCKNKCNSNDNNNNDDNLNNNNNNNNNQNIEISISTSINEYIVGDNIIVDVNLNEDELFNDVELSVKNSTLDVDILKNVITPNQSGELTIFAKIGNVVSNEINLTILPSIYNSNPYLNISKTEFYSNYKESINPLDSYYRSIQGFMSGDITLPDQKPILSDYQPKEDGKFVRNTNAYYSEEKDVYYITDAYGEIVDVIFKDGAYISLDEVASYLLAFGNTPKNHVDTKKGKPSTSIWKEYLRCNNSAFSGSTSKYPYEPMLPRISGCGGDLYYYEVDFGTTGTDCDPGYEVTVYNDGNYITRGAARLVYTRYDANKNNIIDINEKYVFYTYNHYNDFQEFLNYQGGWGEMFGNITGGGALSSKQNYNPTPYVEVVRKDFSKTNENVKNLNLILCDIVVLKKEYFNFI